MAEEVTKLDPFKGIYGLPPKSHVSDDMIINSMPTMEIYPGTPYFSEGLSLFRVNTNWPAYHALLASQGFSTPTGPIKLAFIADNFPTDTFTNDYGETFLQKFTDVASQGLAEIVQMTGQRRGTDALKEMGKFGASAGKDIGGVIGKIIESAGGGVSSAGTGLEKLIAGGEGTEGVRGMMGNAGTILNKMVAGHRVDFPMIWRNSGFTPSYTATVRLYNPNPSSETSTNQYIIGPLAVILCLGLPQSDDGLTYNWPFFHRIVAKGIYDLNPAMITNITVIKGGDQQQIAYNQRLGIVDVRIDIGSLYTSMLAEGKGVQATNRPTLRKYLNSLKQTDTTLYQTREQMRTQGRLISGANREGEVIRVASSASEERQRLIAKNDAVRRRLPPTVSQIVQSTRVPTSVVATEAILIAETPPDFLADDDLGVIV